MVNLRPEQVKNVEASNWESVPHSSGLWEKVASLVAF